VNFVDELNDFDPLSILDLIRVWDFVRVRETDNNFVLENVKEAVKLRVWPNLAEDAIANDFVILLVLCKRTLAVKILDFVMT
jgi:hypothetical protein